MYSVYVIKSKTTGKIYIGQTGNLESRLARHNGLLPSKIKSYTKINKGPWNVVYKEEYNTRQEALKREKYLKSHIGRDWLKNILVR
ncbi:MAG: GIY-YIG nuclease family protein [Candidatus Daviesbacteria bacterium]|nr:GIY-YIG nuclease family protein [Candidatus Daviesbacteria bacterium]